MKTEQAQKKKRGILTEAFAVHVKDCAKECNLVVHDITINQHCKKAIVVGAAVI